MEVCARRLSAFAGQWKGLALALWPICSPRTAFFWSEKVRVAFWMQAIFSSFREAVGAWTTWSLMVKCVLAAEVLAARFRVAMDTFGGAEQPAEADNDEVDDVAIEGATDSVVGVEGRSQATDDGHVDGVDSGVWVVFVLHSSVERSE